MRLFPAVLLGFVFSLAAAEDPNLSWKDSYSVDGQCYCDSTFDHGANKLKVSTPQGVKTVPEICERIGPGPGVAGNPVYNDIQCGNGPANQAGDEDPQVCPGRVDLGPSGCLTIGPTWNLEQYFPADGTTYDPEAPQSEPPTVSQPDPQPEPEPETGSESNTPEATDTGTSQSATTQTSATATAYPTDSKTHSLLLDSTRYLLADARWVRIDSTTDFSRDDYWKDPDGNHAATAQGGTYLELLPDTRVNSDDSQTAETNWSNPGDGPMVTYSIDFAAAGRYAVAVRAYSSGDEDKGVFVGLNNNWPVNGRFIAHCGGDNKWVWTDCYGAHEAWLNVPSAGIHNLVFSASADGFQFDRISLVKYEPGLAAGLVVKTGQRDFLPTTGAFQPLSSSGLIVLLLWRLRRRYNYL